jgi:hypothetical protein
MNNEDLEQQVYFSRLKNNIDLYYSSATQVLRDLEMAESGSVFYNWDYSMAAGFLWSARAGRQNQNSLSNDLDYIGSATFALYSKYAEVSAFKLTASPATLLELLRALLHRADEYSSFVNDKDKFAKFKDALLVASQQSDGMLTADAKKAAAYLSQFSDVLRQSNPKQNFSSLSSMFSDGKIGSLGSIYTVDELKTVANQSKHVRSAVLSELLKIRQRHSNELEEEFHFRNLVDATNIANTIGFDKFDGRRNMYFLGPTPKGLASLRAFDIPAHTRQPFTAFLRLVSLSHADPAHDIHRQAKAMTEKIVQRIHIFLDDLRRAGSVNDLLPQDRRELHAFLRDFITPVFTDVPVASQNPGGTAAYFRENPMVFRDRFKQAEEEMLSAAHQAKEFDKLATSSELLECFDLRDDPVVQKIYRRLGVL